MFKKISVVLMCLLLVFAVGCGKPKDNPTIEKGDDLDVSEIISDIEEEQPKEVLFTNPLTGVSDLTEDKVNARPVALTINNINIAQPVQTGIGKADIVYETEVEGGITRMLAVYKNIEAVEKIGTVRSARYVFIDLAMGHKAIYIHHGMDHFHAKKHLNDVDRIILSTSNGGYRASNGLKQEHTLYANGRNLWNHIKTTKYNTQTTDNNLWQTFAPEGETVTLENAANSVTVPFSSSTKSTFTYDAESGKYIRSFNGTQRKDYSSGELMTFKNVFVLSTTIRNYKCTGEDTYQHREVLLKSGSGYYFVNGTYTPIKWSKGAASNGFTFMKEDGTPLTVNAGNSWVCIADMNKAKPQIS